MTTTPSADEIGALGPEPAKYLPMFAEHRSVSHGQSTVSYEQFTGVATIAPYSLNPKWAEWTRKRADRAEAALNEAMALLVDVHSAWREDSAHDKDWERRLDALRDRVEWWDEAKPRG